MTTAEAKEKILNFIIDCEILHVPDKAIVPISNIIHFIDGLTKYRAKKALKELISEGLIYYTSQGCPALVTTMGEYTELIEESHPPINGYSLTQKGFETEKWKRSYKEFEESMEEWAKPEKEDI